MNTPATHVPTPNTAPCRYPTTTAGLAAALAALGYTAREVADALADGGYTGRPGSCEYCPIARYLTDLFPACGVAVGHFEAELHTATGRRVVADLPDPVEEFVFAFDYAAAYDFLAEL